METKIIVDRFLLGHLLKGIGHYVERLQFSLSDFGVDDFDYEGSAVGAMLTEWVVKMRAKGTLNEYSFKCGAALACALFQAMQYCGHTDDPWLVSGRFEISQKLHSIVLEQARQNFQRSTKLLTHD